VSAAKDLCAVDHHKFTLVRPFIGPYNQSGPHRILAHVFSFLAVTLVVTQHVIKKSRLPERPFFGSAERH
jgi:hypothetical protein